jgi:membrane protein implicated in regulation of membrane protease activity
MRYNKRGVMVTGMMFELVVFAVCIIVGILLLVLGASLNKAKAKDRQMDQVDYINTMRSQLILLQSPFSGNGAVSVADQIILAQSSSSMAEVLARDPEVNIHQNDELYDRFFLPTLEGGVVGVGGFGRSTPSSTFRRGGGPV